MQDLLVGALERHSFSSDVLRGNPLDDPHARPLLVYLPPGYQDEISHRYPSVYVLIGLRGSGAHVDQPGRVQSASEDVPRGALPRTARGRPPGQRQIQRSEERRIRGRRSWNDLPIDREAEREARHHLSGLPIGRHRAAGRSFERWDAETDTRRDRRRAHGCAGLVRDGAPVPPQELRRLGTVPVSDDVPSVPGARPARRGRACRRGVGADLRRTVGADGLEPPTSTL